MMTTMIATCVDNGGDGGSGSAGLVDGDTGDGVDRPTDHGSDS